MKIPVNSEEDFYRLTILIPPEHEQALYLLAAVYRTTRSNLVRKAIGEFLSAHIPDLINAENNLIQVETDVPPAPPVEAGNTHLREHIG